MTGNEQSRPLRYRELVVTCEEAPAEPTLPAQAQVDKLLLSVIECAQLLNIHRATLFEMLARGDLPSVKIGRRRLVSRRALDDFIRRSERWGD